MRALQLISLNFICLRILNFELFSHANFMVCLDLGRGRESKVECIIGPKLAYF